MQNIYGYNSMIPLVSKFPKSCTADCRNGDEGCCEEQWRACNSPPVGNCEKNCRELNKCSNIKGCTTQDVTGDCVASSSPSPPLDGGGCYIYSGGCDKISPDSCDNPINKKLCAHDDCYNGLEQCLEANHHSPSPPSPPHSPSPPAPPPPPPPPSQPHYQPITKHTPWNPDSIKYIKSQIAKNLNTIPKNKVLPYSNCLISKATQNNISPYDFLNSHDPRLKDNAIQCLTTLGPAPSPPPTPSRNDFLHTTTGKIIVIVVIILILLGLIGLTYFVTKTKKK
jgi:hypothetical protein